MLRSMRIAGRLFLLVATMSAVTLTTAWFGIRGIGDSQSSLADSVHLSRQMIHAVDTARIGRIRVIHDAILLHEGTDAGTVT